MTETLYLLRHGEAQPAEIDPERALTPDGRRDVERLADWLGRRTSRIDAIHHSGKRRAEQTAELLARALASPPPVALMAGLAPNDDPREIAGRLIELPHSIALVGHLPHLARLASLLLVGNTDRLAIDFEPGCVVALCSDAGQWHLCGMIGPSLLARDTIAKKRCSRQAQGLTAHPIGPRNPTTPGQGPLRDSRTKASANRPRSLRVVRL